NQERKLPRIRSLHSKKVSFIELIILCARVDRDGDGEKGLRPHRNIIGFEPHNLLTMPVIHLHHTRLWTGKKRGQII
ncbi:hypothetical protein, partial [Pseudomonas synxantha]|uniref:hypothetical protein n=1 Tax=Pseudomonas synxantha TaxID=47883 RepID=UPI001E4B7484